ncbi:MAG: aminopeptidase N [Idiomarina sp.]|nr:aminopeptidase N [Idiomarina sp.]
MDLRPQARYRKDYQAPAFAIPTIDLTIWLDDEQTRVVAELEVERLTSTRRLTLDGEQLSLRRLELDGQLLASGTDYEVSATGLIIYDVPQHCKLRIETEINPKKNTALEGLYKSGGAFCTQCEAEGFRRITYFLDRPDVLSVYTTKVHGNKAAYPFLLSNGNRVDTGEDGDQHWVKWHDPFPKPCYLFALVAGDFDVLHDSFTTSEGRDVALELYVDKGSLDRAQFAMTSLKNSMAWDEERFGLSYDLDIYMIVAVDFFNMGAMENKGLNVFNAKYVLADPESATDQDFLNVESVIGHEYFHNWTGNRITCRDWFQLSLKEGLTVFRDQEFSADRGMRAVNRIQDVRIMRTHQFEEDAGPMAHPIRPDKVMEMNNFYTVTVYNKGAEVIRMLHTLLGEDGFQQGMREYVRRHDGEAVTCEDFVASMEAANDRDFTQFRRWYAQAGTPRVQVESRFDETHGVLTLVMHQHTPATPEQPVKQPFHIPIQLEFIAAGNGQITPPELAETQVIELTETTQEFRFSGFTAAPVVGLLANFSAPVRLDFELAEQDLILLTSFASDPFLRWDAVQRLYLRSLKTAIATNKPIALSASLLTTLSEILADEKSEPAMTALLLQIPSEEAVASEFDEIPVDGIVRAVAELKTEMSVRLFEPLMSVWHRLFSSSADFSSEAIAARMLCNVALNYMAMHHHDPRSLNAIVQQFKAEQSMTLVFGALQAAVHSNHPVAPRLLELFAERWSANALVMDKWLAVQATQSGSDVLDQVKELTEHPAFNWNNPNRVYALLASFTHNLGQLHRADGESYRWMESVIGRLNTSNPQVASRLISPLLKWRRLDPERQVKLKAVLENLRELPQLAPDLFEKIEQSLN